MGAKKELYLFVDRLRDTLGLPEGPVNTVELVSNDPTSILALHHFSTTGFCGGIFFGEKADTVCLNANRTSFEQNFDCGHELIHKYRHRDLGTLGCNCMEKGQNTFVEWEANAGSAELVVPYRQFLPLLKRSCRSLCSWEGIRDFKFRASVRFSVSPHVISVRLEELKYEILQYLNGCPLEGLLILSNSELTHAGLRIQSFNDFAKEDMEMVKRSRYLDATPSEAEYREFRKML